MTSEETIACDSHGEAYSTYLCRHLEKNPRQLWFCDRPTHEEPWPDARCKTCQQAFERIRGQGGSGAEETEFLSLCHCCYEALQEGSVAALMEDCEAAWQPFLDEALDQLEVKQDLMIDHFGFSKHERWDWDEEREEIRFSNAGKLAVVARAQVVGSFSEINDTWLWSWANPSLISPSVDELLAVRSFGTTEGFANLMLPKWPATKCDGWKMTAVAAKLMNAEGAYRMPGDSCNFFALLKDVRCVQ